MIPAKILLVDSQKIMRDGLRQLLRDEPEFIIVGDAFDSETAWLALKNLNPDIIILDLEFPGEGGVELAQRLRQSYPQIKVVIFTGHEEPDIVKAALRAGVHGYALKMNASSELIEALRAVLAGKVYLCPRISAQVLREYSEKIKIAESPRGKLSARELDVLKRIADGGTTKEIALAMGVSSSTIETYRLHLLSKLQVKSVAALTKYAVRQGLAVP